LVQFFLKVGNLALINKGLRLKIQIVNNIFFISLLETLPWLIRDYDLILTRSPTLYFIVGNLALVNKGLRRILLL